MGLLWDIKVLVALESNVSVSHGKTSRPLPPYYFILERYAIQNPMAVTLVL